MFFIIIIYPFMKNSRQPHPSEKFTAPACENSEETELSEKSEIPEQSCSVIQIRIFRITETLPPHDNKKYT